jgi:hypothetical protein
VNPPFTLFIASEVCPINLGIFNHIKIMSLVTAGVASTKRERGCGNERAAMRADKLFLDFIYEGGDTSMLLSSAALF